MPMAKRSASAVGQHYKARTKKWLEARGFHVAHLERLMVIHSKPGMFVKRDQLGADLLAVSDHAVVFVQVKGGVTWRANLAAARTEFERYPLPPCAVQAIVGWSKGARQPEVIVRRSGAAWVSSVITVDIGRST
jgi:hypothetical protein